MEITWNREYAKQLRRDMKYDELFAYCKKFADMQVADAVAELAICYNNGEGTFRDVNKSWELLDRSVAMGSIEGMVNLGRLYEIGNGEVQDDVKAVELYHKAAELGNIRSMYYLGKAYENGTGVENDEVKAVEWYRKAAEQGNAAAQCIIGDCYRKGKGVEMDENAAVEWYQKSAENGYAVGQYNLAVCYETGKGVEQNMTTAVVWYRKAAEQENDNAQYAMGVCCEEGKGGVEQNVSLAVEWYIRAAGQGNVDAMYNLAIHYELGKVVKQDTTLAIKYYRIAAAHGVVEAQLYIASCYALGKVVKQDKTISAEWYRKAAEQGNAEAQFNLGVLYEDGEGVEKNIVTAVEWYRKAAIQGFPEAQYNLGLCYDTGKGVDKDKATAVEWYRKAAEQGDIDARYNLARCLVNSVLKRNHKKAFDLLKTDADVYSESCNILALCYMLGKGTNKNPAHAVELWKKASKMGSNWAQYNLARAYEYGDGIEKNVVAALALYNKASKKGIEDSSLRAKKLVKKIIRELTRYSQKNNAEAQYNLGLFYLNDEYGVKDIDKAITFLNESAKNNYALAQCQLAIIYSEGKQVPTEYNKAFAFLLKAAKNELHIAQLLLSKVYDCGLWGQLENKEEAEYWYSKYEKIGNDDHEDASLEGQISWKFKFRNISGIIIDTLTSKSRIKQLEANIAELKIHNESLEREKGYLESENMGLKKDKQFLQNVVQSSLNKIEDDVKTIDEDMKEFAKQFKEFETYFKSDISPILQTLRNDFKGFKDKIPELFDKYYEQLEKSNEESELIRKQLDKLDEGFAAITKQLNDHFSADATGMREAEEKLRGAFSDEIWNRLLPDSRTSLCSAHLMWERCNKETIDWSGVCILATSALERELKRVFSERFQDYLNRTGQTDLTQWPRCLCYIDNNDYLQPSTRFMLGNFQYMIGAKKDKNPDPNLSEKRKAYLNAIIAEEHLQGIEDATILFTNKKYGGKTFAQRCDFIANNYRNKAAHDDTIDKETASACYNALIPSERAKQTLNNINNLLIILYRLVDYDKLQKYLPDTDE